MIDKGMISAVGDNGKTATVVPAFSGASVTFPLVVPFFLAGSLTVKMPVVYATFPDNTGVILARRDGEWNHDLEGDVNVQGSQIIQKNQTVSGSQSITGTVTAEDLITAAARFNTHVHSCPDGGTSGPQ